MFERLALSKKEIFILGKNGMLGREVCNVFTDSKIKIKKTSRDRGDADIYFDVYGKWKECLDQYDIGVIINCIGLVKQKQGNFYAINTKFPLTLTAYCQKRGIMLIHISSDCVFSGDRGQYTEADVPDAIDFYGRSKACGEVSGKNIYTFRTSFIGFEQNESFGLLEWFISRKGMEANGYDNHFWSGVTSHQLAIYLKDFIFNVDKKKLTSSLYHVGGPDITKYDLLCKINTALSLNITTNKVNLGPGINRTLNSDLFFKETGLKRVSWDEMLPWIVHHYKTEDIK